MKEDTWPELLLNELSEDDRALHEKRAAGLTLRQIGALHALSGERVRQRLAKTQELLESSASRISPDWRAHLALFRDDAAVSSGQLAKALGARPSTAVTTLVLAAGFAPVRVWETSRLPGWWTTAAGLLDSILKELIAMAPFRSDELYITPATSTLPRELPLGGLMGHSRSPLVQDALGHWVRRSARNRDTIYLWLAEQGTPCRVEDMAAVLESTSPHAIREAMRRDQRFAQIRPEGTWVLTQWSHPDVNPYSNAEEAMISVLEEIGATPKERLFARVSERYPVTSWRLQQCLMSDRIGMTTDGLVDLIVHGAEPIQEPEPAQPKTMAVDEAGNLYGLRLTVDHELSRGSGIVVSTWLTWKLGMRRAPMSMTFTIIGTDASLTVRRATSGAQLSSLRQHAHDLGAGLGCQLAILLRVNELTARIQHACADEACPALRRS